MKQNNRSILYGTLFAVVTLFLGYAFFVWTLIPHQQMVGYYKLVNRFKRGDITSIQAFKESNKIFEPYTYLQPDIRNELMYEAFIAEQQGKPGAEELMVFAIEKLEDVLLREKEYVKYYHSLARAYTDLAQGADDKTAYLAKAEKYYAIARELSPESPEIAYMYSISLNNQKRFDESLALLRLFIEKDPRIMNTYYYYGLALYRSGESNYNEALDNLEKSLSALKKIEYSEVNKQMYQKLFAYYYQQKDKARFIITVRRLIQLDPKQINLYEQIIDYMEKKDSIPPIKIT